MSLFEILQRVIARGGYDAEDIQTKMDVFFLYDRLTAGQYDALHESMR